jgi:undecaprenyl-diphosphatase
VKYDGADIRPVISVRMQSEMMMIEKLNILFFQWIHSGAGQQPILDKAAVFCAVCGPYVLGVVLVLLWFFSNMAQKISLLEATEAGFIGLGINQAIGLFYFHPRPFMEGLCTSLIPHIPETSFPSDHVSLLTAASGYVLFFSRRRISGALLWGITCLTAWARVYAGLHFPLDMLGAVAVGVIGIGIVRQLKTWSYPVNKRLFQTYDRLASGISLYFQSSNPDR